MVFIDIGRKQNYVTQKKSVRILNAKVFFINYFYKRKNTNNTRLDAPTYDVINEILQVPLLTRVMGTDRFRKDANPFQKKPKYLSILIGFYSDNWNLML